MQPTKEWFSEWFDSPYYHILYKNRDMLEAEFFLSNLVKQLGITPELELVDLACGKGRHSIYLNQLGCKVTGVDLSVRSIEQAKQFENSRLHFEVKDLRNLGYHECFDVGLNLFTSFGYFDCDDTNRKVMGEIYKAIKPGGLFVLDFMNVHKVIRTLISNEVKEADGITFHIERFVKNNLLIKSISFSHQNKAYKFCEEVQLLNQHDFEILLKDAGFTLITCYGNYALEAYDQEQSDRLILIAKRNA